MYESRTITRQNSVPNTNAHTHTINEDARNRNNWRSTLDTNAHSSTITLDTGMLNT